MKRLFQILVIGALVALLTTLASAQVPQMINYQGKLTTTAGAPVNATVQMVFTIYDADVAGNVLWTETQPAVTVDKGVFNVLLGSVSSIPYSVFDGSTRYLGVKVGGDPEITPRKPMVSVAYAYRSAVGGGGADNDWVFPQSAGGNNPRPYLYTYGAWGIARYGNVLWGNYDSTHVNLGVACTTGAGGNNYKYCTVGGGYVNTASAWYATVGGGYHNTASGPYATVGGGYVNTTSGPYATVGGGYVNTAGAWSATVGGGYYNTASGKEATVGGGWYNTASGQEATVGGGSHNTASGDSATVGGGSNNTAYGIVATVGGGSHNTASGDSGTVGGGAHNTASGRIATVGGGANNIASVDMATVGGGLLNSASDTGATVGGGRANTAMGDYSTVGSGYSNFAAGDSSTIGGGAHNTVSGNCATVGGGWYNGAIGRWATVGGGSTNDAIGDYATVGGGLSNTTSSGDYATVGGGQSNTASEYGATVGGGYDNLASGGAATVGGGEGNTASGPGATVGGGDSDTASGDNATVGGGYDNTASGSCATVGGGANNTASGIVATVGGGWMNLASGEAATVGGGWKDTSAADYSFTVGDHSVVPSGYNNSAAFNGQTATASGQTRVGILSKASGSFTIDHPLDPDNKILNHYFVESPEMVNMYRGVAYLDANGRAEVRLPDYFDALNRNPMVQLTGVGTSDVFVAEEVSGNRFVIGGKPAAKVFWMVTGDRKDQSAEITRIIMPVEQPKTGALAGRSLDDDFLSTTMQQLERMGEAGKFSFRTTAARQRYEDMKRMLDEKETEK